MKIKQLELSFGKDSQLQSLRKVLLPILLLILLTTLSLYFPADLSALQHNLGLISNGSFPLHNINDTANEPPKITLNKTLENPEHHCNIFLGSWIPYPDGPYYTNETKCVIDDRQNCMKFGRPDSGYMKWRWKPDDCDLPRFDSKQFLQLVTGKTLAFVGDSVARNQLQSLMCLLASAEYPEDISPKNDTRVSRWFYSKYNFTLEELWSPLLVRTQEADPNGYSGNSLMRLYLDEADQVWTDQIETADIVIISAGQWFFRPFMYYLGGQIVGCHKCGEKNITNFYTYYGLQMAFRTAFRAILNLQSGNKLVFLRTFSPSHFENGDWDKGGSCMRKRPLTKQETKLEWYILKFYSTQVEELKAAQREGEKKSLRFRLLNTTEAMVMRPDGHPNHYGHSPQENKTMAADCVHWCLPGPVETWNEFLLHMLHVEEKTLPGRKPQDNAQGNETDDFEKLSMNPQG